MTIKLPKTTIFGEPVKGAIERVFKEQDAVPEPETVAVSLPPNIVASDYLRIPGTNTIISRLELPDYNNMTWKDTHFKLHEDRLFMPTPNLFISHFLNVVDAHKNKKPLFDAAGNPIPENKLEEIYLHLTLQANGTRTWLDAKFEEDLGEGTMKIHTNHRVINDELKAQTIQDLEQCIKEECYVKLEFNSQGLPTKKSENQEYVQGKNLYYLHPENGKVAGFLANFEETYFNCDWMLDYSTPDLGVFACAGASQKDSKDFIYVPSIGSYVAKEKTLHNLDWNQTHEELKKKGSRMPTIPEFIGFVNHLKQKPTPEYHKILDEILSERDPWRAEHLDAIFEEIVGKITVYYAGKTEKLDPSTLMEKRIPGIDIDYWLKNPTNQGLPSTNTPTGNLRYWHPENGTVARFAASSNKAFFNGGGELNYFNSRLGVREVRKTAP